MPMVVPHAHHDAVCALCSRAVKQTLVGHLRGSPGDPSGVWRYQHVRAIIVAIDQDAEAASDNRGFFLSKPPRARQGDVP